MVLNVCWFHLFWLISISFPDLWCWWRCVHKNLCKRVKTSIFLSSGMESCENPQCNEYLCVLLLMRCCMWLCVVPEPISSDQCILLSFFIADTIPSHRYASISCVCFVFCSCHLLWFHRLLNLLGITHRGFGCFNRKAARAVVRTGTAVGPGWSQWGVPRLLASPVLSGSGSTSWASERRGASELQHLWGAAGCSLERRVLLLSFFLACLLGRGAEEQILSPVIAGTVIQQNPLSCCVSEGCPNFPCWDAHYPSTNPGCIYRTNNIVIMTNSYCLHTQAPPAWSESQQNLTDLTCLGHKKIKLRNLLVSYLLTCDRVPVASLPFSSHFWWQYFILWTTKYFTRQGHSSRMKEMPDLMYLSWLRVLATTLSILPSSWTDVPLMN